MDIHKKKTILFDSLIVGCIFLYYLNRSVIKKQAVVKTKPDLPKSSTPVRIQRFKTEVVKPSSGLTIIPEKSVCQQKQITDKEILNYLRDIEKEDDDSDYCVEINVNVNNTETSKNTTENENAILIMAKAKIEE